MSIRRLLAGLLITTVLAFPGLATAGPSEGDAARIQANLNYAGPLPASTSRIKLENLVGHLSVTQGSSFRVTATVVAGGSNQADAQALAQSVHFDTSQSGNEFTLHVHYPVDRYTSYSYPERSDNGNKNYCFVGIFCVDASGSSLSYQDTDVRVYRSGRRGVPLHVDVAVQLPAGMSMSLVNYVGLAEASGIHNDLRIKTSSGNVQVSKMQGRLSADTGSGDVHVADLTGNLSVDTGSGDVFAERLRGNLHADTGSGDVHVSDSQGQTLYADTGSGDVLLSEVKGDMKFDTGSGDVKLEGGKGSLHADTGSGDVIARNYAAGSSVWADTGSGEVSLFGDLSAVHNLYIDTGSGDATIKTSTGLSMHLDAHSDSGDVNINLPEMHNVVMHRGKFVADFGKAEGQGTISTGSGDINVTRG
ncbi:MAG: DUF4097 family beta strand repeat protein [Gammaproteobacteria bacterium]|nr:DUF4097 family beta strand repeat protein [Gammaproteobacteria bacterium]